MVEKKNQVTVLIEYCCHCPNATLKYDKEENGDYMYCQTQLSCMQLRKCWGKRPIPDWCPRLNHSMSPKRSYVGKRAEIPGIVS